MLRIAREGRVIGGGGTVLPDDVAHHQIHVQAGERVVSGRELAQ
jgi:hypothetical protein